MDSTTEIIDSLSKAIDENNMRSVQIGLMTFFSRIPFIIPKHRFDSTAIIFKLIDKIFKSKVGFKSERDRIAQNIQSDYIMAIFTKNLDYNHNTGKNLQSITRDLDPTNQPNQKSSNEDEIDNPEHEIELIDNYQSNGNSGYEVAKENDNIEQIQTFIESQFEILVNLYFSFSDTARKEAFPFFRNICSIFPSNVVDNFEKFLNSFFENKMTNKEFEQITPIAIDLDAVRINFLLFEKIKDLHFHELIDQYKNKIGTIFQILSNHIRTYPEAYWDHLDICVELFNPHYGMFANDILKILSYYVRKGAGELLIHLKTFFEAVEIPEISSENIIMFLRDVLELVKKPDFHYIIFTEGKINPQIENMLFQLINNNNDENEIPQIAFDYLTTMIEYVDEKNAILRKILDHLIEQEITQLSFWIHYAFTFDIYFPEFEGDTSPPPISQFINIEEIEEIENIIEVAKKFADAWKNN